MGRGLPVARSRQSITKRISQAREQIELEKKQLETARKKAENARETQRTLSEQVRKRSAEGAPQAALRDLWLKISALQNEDETRKQARERVEALEPVLAP